MNLKTQNAKNIISKDNILSDEAAKTIVNNCDFESFKTLCDNSDCLFEHIIDKIIKKLVCATNSNNIETTFEFSKCYNLQIGEYILKSWLKFANEDITDRILLLFETGTVEQKIYAAKYFETINDTLALELLYKNAFNDNEDLSAACANTLAAFADEQMRQKALTILQSDDEFKKLIATKFLINFGNKEDISVITDQINISPFGANIAAELLYKYSYETLKDNLTTEKTIQIFDEVINAYPEDIPLETVLDFNLAAFMEDAKKIENNSYCSRLLADAKNIFKIINSDNIYTYDLKGEYLDAVRKIDKLFENYKIEAVKIIPELSQSQKRITKALNTIINIKSKDATEEIKKLYTKTTDPLILCECARAAKSLNISIDKNTGISKIADENAMELFKSYF